ncbi:Endoglucanase 3 precursor [Hartmannibacter diazotrophicus]|uniref:Exo-1,3-beta-glucanase D n=1 Tax=Hartmannibacter diazotrophicus TaxID=1482074 RepID=A0A2C9D3S3_9HYPH|nr:cellulase family glycosylhydrolase [Hartmannibacter diazotrophicus]SON54808.1 Endoglucanase 3 precursor [Hartmannibacter diazotrophicus]
MRPVQRLAAAAFLSLLGLGGLAGGMPASAAEGFPACLAERSGGVAADRVQALARGFNIPSWMDRPDGKTPSRTVLRHLRLLGMTHVRLPVRGELVMARFMDPTAVAAQLSALRGALSLLLDEGYAVSVDLHPGGPFADLYKSDPEAAAKAVENAWDNLASVITQFPPDRIFAEVLNEPVTDEDTWRVHLPRFLAHMRALMPETTLIAEPYGPQRPEVLLGMKPVDDPNVVYAVHFYDPMAFTHQGLTWSTDADPLTHLKNVPFPASKTDPAIRQLLIDLRAEGHAASSRFLDSSLSRDWTPHSADRLFEAVADWSAKNNRVVILNEFGVLRFAAQPDDRARWLASVVTAAEDKGCVGWTHWDFADGFGLLDPSTGLPDPLVMKALFEPEALLSDRSPGN